MSGQDVTSPKPTSENPLTSVSTEASDSKNPDAFPALDAPVDPDTYRVGPFDQLVITIPQLQSNVPLVVSPDNQVILPRGFAPLDVGGMTLSELKDTVTQLYQARSNSYRNVVISLAVPRRVRVRVVGDVLASGSLVLTAADRVSTAVDAANTPGDRLSKPELEAQLLVQADRRRSGEFMGTQTARLRSVIVRHIDGTSEIVDLVRWRYLADATQNPSLREGDEIEVPVERRTEPMIGVSGGVGKDVSMPFRPGDNALLLLRCGAAPAGPGIRYELKRAGNGGIQSITLDGSDTAALDAMLLRPGDYLIVTDDRAEATTGRGTGMVEISGEVMREGTYPIVPGVTNLSDVFAAAGGPTPNAALNGARIDRKIDRSGTPLDHIVTDPVSVMSTSSLSLEDTTRLSRDIRAQSNRVSVDVAGLIGRRDMSCDVALQDGDRIVVPPNPRHVEIIGRVSFPGAVAYVAGATLAYYVDKVGGFTNAADRSRVEVTRFGNGVWENPTDVSIMPGDVIYVPGEREAPARTPLEITATILGIAGALAGLTQAIIGIVNALTRK